MGDEETVKIPPRDELDLRGVACPLSWAKARVALDELSRGDCLTLILDEDRALRDIPRAAEAQGYSVEPPVQVEGAWRLRVTV